MSIPPNSAASISRSIPSARLASSGCKSWPTSITLNMCWRIGAVAGAAGRVSESRNTLYTASKLKRWRRPMICRSGWRRRSRAGIAGVCRAEADVSGVELRSACGAGACYGAGGGGAAVVVPREGRWHLPLTERPETLVHHGGQISLPGGAIEAGESSRGGSTPRVARGTWALTRSYRTAGATQRIATFSRAISVITPWVAAADDSSRIGGRACVRCRAWSNCHSTCCSMIGAVGRLTIERGPLVFHAPCIQSGGSQGVGGDECHY